MLGIDFTIIDKENIHEDKCMIIFVSYICILFQMCNLDAMKEISIIIPAYNAASFISKPLESLRRQTFKQFEIIVVDDGSKDATQTIVDEYCREGMPIRYFYQQNHGVSVARNVGIRQACGKYIMFLDADDELKESYLQVMYETLEIQQKVLGLCGFSFMRDGREVGEYLVDKIDTPILQNFLLYGILQTACWFMRLDALRQAAIEFPEGMNYAEDMVFFCKMLYWVGEENIVRVNQKLVYYNLRENSLSDRGNLFSMTNIQNSFVARKNIYEYIRMNPHNDADGHYLYVLRYWMKRNYCYILWKLAIGGKKKEKRKLIDQYYTDSKVYCLNKLSLPLKHRIWLFLAKGNWGWILILLRPYKYWQHKRNNLM